jgi:hypothetical protein
MMRRPVLVLAVMLAAAPAAQAQFELFRVNGNAEVPVPSLYDFGPIYPGETASTHFRLRNASSSAAILSVLNAAGAGFTLTGPAVPLAVAPAAAVDFTVTFSAATVGSYSANLEMTGLPVLLTAAVAPSLTYSVVVPSGRRQLGTATVDFGSVGVGSAAALHFTAVNQTQSPLIVPAIAVQGRYFTLSGSSPSGQILQAQQQAAFDVQFAPLSSGTFTAGLVIGDRTYSVSGTAPPLPLPVPRVSVNLPQPLSAQQGSVAVTFDAPAATDGDGTLTLDFQPSTFVGKDSAVAFAAGGRTLGFTFSAGDTQARFGAQPAALFQTGTTAATIAFTATIGPGTAQQSVTVSPALVSVAALQVDRVSNGLTLQLTAYDNTQSLSVLTFTFFDAAGNVLTPGGLTSSARNDFQGYYSASDLGGLFRLNAQFPVTGDISAIRSVEVQLTNSAGTAKSPRTSF